MITREEVVWAYRAFLGREPENESVVEGKVHCHATLESVAREFMASEEFRCRLVPWAPLGWPPIRVDVQLDPARLERLYEHVREVWSRLGSNEPYWSVLSADQFRTNRFAESCREFYDSGRDAARTFSRILERVHLPKDRLRTLNELGCGVGRVTRWLAESFERVVACDVSSAHLALAGEYLRAEGVTNVELRQLAEVRAAAEMPSCDAAFSILVLQHNPPPVIAHLVRSMLAWLNSGGVAFLQVPTYAVGYVFDADAYLRGGMASDRIEMHVLPQRDLLTLVEEAGCAVLEIREDGCVGLPGWISNSLLVQRKT